VTVSRATDGTFVSLVWMIPPRHAVSMSRRDMMGEEPKHGVPGVPRSTVTQRNPDDWASGTQHVALDMICHVVEQRL
jgi:hypothetical protein